MDEILPRETELIRPPIANAKLAVLLFSLREPDLNLQLLDKFLVHIEHAGLKTLICLTKGDLLNEEEDEAAESLLRVQELYRSIGYEVIVTSSATGAGTGKSKRGSPGRSACSPGSRASANRRC